MSATATLFIFWVLFAAEAPKTGALLQTLPADGAWATFQVNVAGDGKDIALTWTLRSVGTVFHEGKPCRCLELEQTPENGRQDIYGHVLGPVIWRIIVPEAAFGEGKEPLTQAVKIWMKADQNDPVLVPSIDAQDPILAAIVRGPTAKLKAEEKLEKINWQQGELACAVVSGSQEFAFAGSTFQLASRVLRHRDVPFFTAGLRQELKAVIGNQEYKVVIQGTLRDHGKDAKPKLPQLVP